MNWFRHAIGKWWETVRVNLMKQSVYKLNFLLFIVGPSLVFFLVKVNLWQAVFQSTGETIGDFTLDQMLEYQGWVLIIALLSQSFHSMNLAEDIRLGRITSYLVYPFEFWQFHFGSFIASLLIQGIAALITGALLLGLDFFVPSGFWIYVQAVAICLLVAFNWFAVCFLIGILSFWLEETWVFRVIFLTVAGFFSGSLIPISLFPNWLAKAVMFTPFPYFTYIPAKFFMNQAPLPFGEVFITLVFWLGVLSAVCVLVWRKGLKMYTAAGV